MSQMNSSIPLLIPNWNAPKRVRACMTLRQGGVSLPPFDALNLGIHVGDQYEHVMENRARLLTLLPSEPIWLTQTHGTHVWRDEWAMLPETQRKADAICTRMDKRVCAILTADCLPVLFCDRAGEVVAAAHAGWRGLLNGVLLETVMAMSCSNNDIMAWLGPAILQHSFEVGHEVFELFCKKDANYAQYFIAGSQKEKYLADLQGIATLELQTIGLNAANIFREPLCTVEHASQFFSYRRDQQTGRMASLIWLE